VTITSALGAASCCDASVLLESHRAGPWVPNPAERELAEGLARSRWDAHVLRAALREATPGVRSGLLADVLAPAAGIVDQEPGAQDAVLQLRVLASALTTWP
jgi:hypothetical protein